MTTRADQLEHPDIEAILHLRENDVRPIWTGISEKGLTVKGLWVQSLFE